MHFVVLPIQSTSTFYYTRLLQDKPHLHTTFPRHLKREVVPQII